MEFLLIVLILAALAYFVSVPLRRSGDEAGGGEPDPRVAALEARKEAKYREIKDAEMDRAAGKLSSEDFERLNSELRREAIEILEEIDAVGAERADAPIAEPADASTAEPADRAS